MINYPPSELILNADNSIYHLNLHPKDIAHIIINVGDPDRVKMVSSFFSKIELKKQKREFVTHTGTYKNKRISVISTGIGTDNIDIVYNELDALVNIDLVSREEKGEKTKLKFIRLGTSGALQEDIPVDQFVFSSYGIGLDGLLNYYLFENTNEEKEIINEFLKVYPTLGVFPKAYIAKCSLEMERWLSKDMISGITCSCSGFYAPQGRRLRYDLARPDMLTILSSFNSNGHRITNFEMETGAMFGLAKVLGHDCCSVNLIVANRIRKEFSTRYKVKMNEMIEMVLERIVAE